MISARRHQNLSAAARRFCDAFAHKHTIDALVTHFATTCEVLEHGLSRFAPFIGAPFTDHDGVRRYFDTVAALIAYEDMRFSEYVVDGDVGKVSVKGTATFTWIATRESWEETFAYVLDFDDEDKITRYQIWGDTGALYLASQGRLTQVRASLFSVYPGLAGQLNSVTTGTSTSLIEGYPNHVSDPDQDECA